MTRFHPEPLAAKLERNCGPDPINPAADLIGIAFGLLERIHTLRAELRQLEVTFNHAVRGGDLACQPNRIPSDHMFSIAQKRHISDAIQKLLQDTGHPELPDGEIQFELHVFGEASWSFANISNNGAASQETPNA